MTKETTETSNRFQKAITILKTQGLKPLLKNIGIFISQLFYLHMSYYVYEYPIKPREEKDYLPKITDYTNIMVTNPKQIYDLASKGFDFSPQTEILKKRITADAAAFCMFVKMKIVHIGYIGFSDKAMRPLKQPPYKVDFPNHQAFTGGGWTNPEYRGLGLATYGYFKRLEYLKDQEILTALTVVRLDNFASNKMHAKFKPKIRAQGHLYRVSGCPFWIEKPFKGDIKT